MSRSLVNWLSRVECGACNCNSCTLYGLEIRGYEDLFDMFAAYLVVADEEFGRQIPFAFLERVKEDFKRRYAGGKADSAIAHSLDKEFG